MDVHAGSRNFYPEVTYINPAHLLIKDRTYFKGDGSETQLRGILIIVTYNLILTFTTNLRGGQGNDLRKVA